MATVTVQKSDLERLKEFTKNTQWFLENIENLRSKYPDRFIAVFDSGDIVVDAPTMEELLHNIIAKGKNPEFSAIEFVTREPFLLIV